jgi:hypothetical protein
LTLPSPSKSGALMFEVAEGAPDPDVCGCNSVVKCHLAKVDVEGSSPFTRSQA